MQIVEHQHHGHAARVGLEKSLEYRAAQLLGLVGVVVHRARERALLELEIEELPEKVGHVADLAVLEHLGHLGADLRLGAVGVHALDQPETRPQQPREHAVGGVQVARAGAVHARRPTRALVALPEDELLDQPSLANPGRSEQRNDARFDRVGVGEADLLERLLHDRKLLVSAHERRPDMARRPPSSAVNGHRTSMRCGVGACTPTCGPTVAAEPGSDLSHARTRKGGHGRLGILVPTPRNC